MPELSTHDEAHCEAAERLAATIAADARRSLRPRERRRRRRVARLATDEASKTFLLELTDEILRIRTARRAARRLADLIRSCPSPAMAGPADRIALRAAASLAPIAPSVVVALATARLRRELSTLVLPAEQSTLRRHLLARRAQGMRCNVNLLGEAVLGEGQAAERARRIEELLGRPEVDCVSVKLSALYSQMDVLAYEPSLEHVRRRLRPILHAAARHSPAKLVYFDMEEYRDLHLTVDAFTSLLDEPPFAALQAGIALQAYLPDSVDVLESLCAFARTRHAATGASIRVRLVKGANLAMERVESELRGWPTAPFATKEEVDANYKRLLDIALAPEQEGALRVGVASHNLFDVAWALTLDAAAGGGRVEVEMLEGMAIAEAEAVARAAGSVLLYAPVVRRDDFESAVAYLVRRFDENTAPENYLAHLASLDPGSAAWDAQRARFRQAVADSHRPSAPSRRQHAPRLGDARSSGDSDAPGGTAAFSNAPDTDFSVAANRHALAQAMAELGAPRGHGPVHAVVGGRAVTSPLTGIGVDPSAPSRALYRYVESDVETVDRAVALARAAAPRWAETSPEERRCLVARVGDEMARGRAATIAVMAADAGKIVREADSEISEAIDGAWYYGTQAVETAQRYQDVGEHQPLGVVVVAPPWNFPYAIPSGGVLAAIAAGNTAILKPAPETVLTASLIVAQCHAAGIPGDVVQFLPCADAESGQQLVTHPDVDAVVLTGAWETARRFLGWRPELALHAETSGKNAIVVTAAADLEDAVRDIVHSAFSHAGQKCSAASLLILEAPVYDDARFLARLADAVSSMQVGPAGDVATRVGPLIRPPSGPLERALSALEPGERWLVEPRQVGDNPHLWSPGVKLGVTPGSEFHLTECFGPVLGVLRARDLDHAIALQNATAYGLTAGISSLDEREADRWCDLVSAGNLYVNRHITGAIVRRQPFGGWKRSSIGPGAKAGGPNYVASLGRWRRCAPLDVPAELRAARLEAKRLLAGEDPSGLVAEEDLFRLRPLRRAVLRLVEEPDTGALEVSLGVAAALGVAVQVSWAPAVAAAWREARPPRTTVEDGVVADGVVEDDDDFVERIRSTPMRPDRVRLVGSAPSLRLALFDAGLDVDVEPLVAIGGYEVLRWTREQAVSVTLHRHGNVVAAREGRRPSR
ncbi:MAG: proline dehydrogenase family protein [Acidimicrobiales bacterium]